MLAAVLPFVIQLFNAGVVWGGQEAPLALGGFLERAAERPWSDGFWPLSMLLTTLFPTALHAGALIVTLFLWLIQPAAWRRSIVDGLASDDEKDLAWAAFRAGWLVVLTPIGAGALVLLIGYGILQLIGLIEPVGLLLLDAARLGIDLADVLVGPATP